MSFGFIHTADWQIGKAFGTMPKDVALALTEARLSAIDRVADAARARGLRHVLIAGDVFDGQTLSLRTLRQACARLASHGAIAWHALPGNHDAHRPGGIWERLLSDDPPPNLRAHLTPAATEIEAGVWLLPAPLTGRAATADPTAHFDAVDTPLGALRIGFAHGSVRGFGSDGAASILIAENRAKRAGLHYLALGDWHGTKQIDPSTWYCGTPEPDRFTDNDPGHVLSVRIDAGGSAPMIERVRTGQFVWARTALELPLEASFAALDAEIATLAAKRSDVLLKLAVFGRASAAERQSAVARLDRMGSALRYFDCDLSALDVKTSVADLEALGPSGSLRAVGRKLVDLGTPEAADALAILYDIAAQAGIGR